MNRRLSLVCAISVCFGSASLQVGCISAGQSTSSAQTRTVARASALLLDLTPEELYQDATVVIRARVDRRVRCFSVPTPSGDDRAPGSTQDWIYTEWSVIPSKVYKSDGVIAVGEPITVALRGGELGNEVVEWDLEAEFSPGEDVLLYLGNTDGAGTQSAGRYFTHQLLIGKYRIDKKSGLAINKDAHRNTKFADLEAKLK